jgi:hypothetical protein
MQIQIKGLDKLTPAVIRRVRLAAAKALANTLDGCRTELRNEIKDSFDRPTPMIVNSVKTRQEDTSGAVYISDEDYSSGPIRSESESVTPANILAPHIFGGSRISKNSEMRLRRKKVLRQDQYITPGPAARRDRYGNISGQEMIRILSAAGLLEDSGFTANQGPGSRKRNRGAMRGVYCVPFVGIFQHTASQGSGNRRWATNYGGASVPLLFFSNKPRYEARRFDFFFVVKNHVKKNFPGHMARHLRGTINGK